MIDLTNKNPTELSELLLKLSGDYSFNAGQWEDIQNIKSEEWLKLRDTCTSDTQADRRWALTELGKNEIIYKSKLKTLAIIMSNIKARLRIAIGEAHNQF